MNINIDSFFALDEFAHADVFHACEFPWQVLGILGNYLAKLKFGVSEGKISSSAYLVNPETIYIGKNSVVEPGAYIQGPCWIGNNCVVRHGAYIRGQLLTGDHCVIGHDTEVKNSIFLNGAHAAHFAYVGDTILGNNVNLGAGVKCANFNLNKKPVIVRFEKQSIETHMRKLGAIVGDYSQIGCNSVLNPGTLVGKEVNCYPCLNIGGWIPDKSLVKPASKAVVIPLEPV
jgi:NDP-sugar pyrophosphorylase family protein